MGLYQAKKKKKMEAKEMKRKGNQNRGNINERKKQ